MKFRRKVQHGSETGKKIGFPTINLNVGNFKDHYKPGVFISDVEINKKHYKGALYFGPKMNHKGNVLEVFIIDFSDSIYNKFISFSIDKKIRNPISFNNLEDLKKQIKKDLIDL